MRVIPIASDISALTLLIIMLKTKYTRENLLAAVAAVKNVLGSVKGLQTERNKRAGKLND